VVVASIPSILERLKVGISLATSLRNIGVPLEPLGAAKIVLAL
jgi:hypothetical protein